MENERYFYGGDYKGFYWIPLVWTGLIELYSIWKGWEGGIKGGRIRADYIPGDLGFDPFVSDVSIPFLYHLTLIYHSISIPLYDTPVPQARGRHP